MFNHDGIKITRKFDNSAAIVNWVIFDLAFTNDKKKLHIHLKVSINK